MQVPPKTTVKFPNLFAGYLNEEPTINPNYTAVKAMSERKIHQTGLFSSSQVRGIIACDFSYFASVMIPYADAELLGIVCGWGNWIFPFDDLFDNGEICKDSVNAQIVMQRLEESFCERDGDEKDQPLLQDEQSSKRLLELAQIHGGIYRSIAERCSQGIRQRYVASMRQYSSGTLAQVRQAQSGQAATFEEILAQRRQSVCVTPLFVLVEFGHKIDLPDEDFENANIQRLEMLGVEIILLHNDLLSYCKEEDEHVIHNTVAVCRLQGMGAQEAVTFVGTEVSCRMAEFEEAVHRLGESSGIHVKGLMRYVQGIRDVIRANLWWSFRTERFLSKEQKFKILTRGTLEVASNMPCCQRVASHVMTSAAASSDSDEEVVLPLPSITVVQARAA